jgi:hypothetical protein
MFRLVKLCVSLAAFCAFAWFGATVKLGSRTLFEHLRAIGQTKESQELVDGTKQAAGPLVDDVKRRISAGAAAKAETSGPSDPSDKADDDDGPRGKQAHLPALPPDAGAPRDDFSPSERRQLRRMLGYAEHHASR